MNKIAFIVNPISGGKNKKKIIELIKKRMSRESVEWEIVPTQYAGHAITLAAQSQADVVVAVGGDGTVNEVATGLTGTGKALGIIPCGSGDGLALHLGLSRKPSKALEQLLCGQERPMDAGDMNGHPFFCTTGAGLDADVSLAFAKAASRGLKTYISKGWSTWKHYVPQVYNINVDGARTSLPAMFVTVANANQWGNRAKIAPGASVSDGVLEVTVVKPFKLLSGPSLLWRLFAGSAYKGRKVVHLRGKDIVIERPSEGAVHFDGDPSQEGSSLHVTVKPSALKVITPKDKI